MRPRPCGACRALVFECEHWRPSRKDGKPQAVRPKLIWLTDHGPLSARVYRRGTRYLPIVPNQRTYDVLRVIEFRTWLVRLSKGSVE